MRVKSLALVCVSLMTNLVEGGKFYKECLSLTEDPVGNPNVNDRSITNDIELVKLNSRMRMSSVRTCTNENGGVTGLALRLKEPGAEEETELQFLGYEGVYCDQLALRGQLTRMEASLT